jgi:DnaJ-class molecular chaperone
MKWIMCELCEGEGIIGEDLGVICPKCKGKGGKWVEDGYKYV